MTLKEKISIIDITKLSDKGKDAFSKIKSIARTDAKAAGDAMDKIISSAKNQGKDIFKAKKGGFSNVYRSAGSILHKKVGDNWAYPLAKRKKAARVLTRANTAKNRAINDKWQEYRAKQKGYSGLGGVDPMF